MGLRAAGGRSGPPPKRSDSIRYIREEIPAFNVPAYEGESYTAIAPDTLDLQERARLAVNGLTGPTDAEADYEIYSHVGIYGNRPVMHHGHNDHLQMKFQEALPLMRLITGSHLNEQVDRRWMEVVLHMQGPDGLLYYPVVGRPWAGRDMAVEQFGPLPQRHYAQPYSNGRLLAAVMVYHKLTGDDLWLQVGREMVGGLWRLVLDRGDYAYFAKGQYGPDEELVPDAPIPGPWISLPFAWTMMGLAQFFRYTGYGPAGELTSKLTRYFRKHARFFDAKGRFLPEEPDGAENGLSAHLHGHTYPLLGMLDLALATQDSELVEFVREGYEHCKRLGEGLTGYFPEGLDPRQQRFSEICGVADMIALGLKLTEAGAGDYWDEVDRWTRNMFAEGQLVRYDWMYRVGAGQPHFPIDNMYETDEQVAERSVGAFASEPSPNDWFGSREQGGNSLISHCCTGNGTRTIYYLWENVVHKRGHTLQVNLLLNHASQWADVDSHIPYVGQVDVKVKHPVDLSIRIPEWVKPADAVCRVAEVERPLGWAGRYAEIGEVKPGDVVTLTFPITEHSETVWIEKRKYTLVRKGNDIVAIDPPGQICPLYQREHYRASATRWRKVVRFVSKETVHH